MFRSPPPPPPPACPPPPSLLLLPPPPPPGSLLQLLLLLAVRVRFPFRAAFPFRSPSSSISRLGIDVLRRCDRVERKDDGAAAARRMPRRGRDHNRERGKEISRLPPLYKTRRTYCKKHIARGVTSRTSKTCRTPTSRALIDRIAVREPSYVRLPVSGRCAARR